MNETTNTLLDVLAYDLDMAERTVAADPSPENVAAVQRARDWLAAERIAQATSRAATTTRPWLAEDAHGDALLRQCSRGAPRPSVQDARRGVQDAARRHASIVPGVDARVAYGAAAVEVDRLRADGVGEHDAIRDAVETTGTDRCRLSASQFLALRGDRVQAGAADCAGLLRTEDHADAVVWEGTVEQLSPLCAEMVLLIANGDPRAVSVRGHVKWGSLAKALAITVLELEGLVQEAREAMRDA
ncbi:hypothetical protein AAEX63_01820 [Luteococcus sp. H138]|uniref:hypothetical protein n=1 Tax=Luteococcus sp. H138 TaxID=3139404 RepID=UPI00313D156A